MNEAKELVKQFKKRCYCDTYEGTFYGPEEGAEQCAWCEAQDIVSQVYGVRKVGVRKK